MIRVKRGLELPVGGQPSDDIVSGAASSQVAITGPDYAGMRPSLLVRAGDKVKIGQPLFTCKKNEGLVFTAPGGGTVREIVRGEKRVFQTLVIDLDRQEEHVDFKNYSSGIDTKDVAKVRSLILESGLWTRIRERPYDKTPAVNAPLPNDIFVSISDTNPLAPKPDVIIRQHAEDFNKGLEVLSGLAERHLFVTIVGNRSVHLPALPKMRMEQFRGPHPAGNVGTQMHFLSPPTLQSKVWYVGYQDVIALGHLFNTGRLMTLRYVGIGGPKCKLPKIYRTRFGAELGLLTNELINDPANTRVISGSIFHGRACAGPFRFLGAFHNQVSLIEEDRERELLGWHMPGFNKFSVKNVFFSKLLPAPRYNITTSTHGSHRALVPFGHYEKVCAFDTLATQLLKALLVGDTDFAQKLGVLEMGEEDVALFTFVSTSKTDFGPLLRKCLDTIEKEG